jgi:hypothetical protein
MLTQENNLIFEAYLCEGIMSKRVTLNGRVFTFYVPDNDPYMLSFINALDQQRGETPKILNSLFSKLSKIGFNVDHITDDAYRIKR